ncbi:MAG: hypothetical protein AAGC47_02640 [Bacteroidota bacterium]
MDFNRNDFLLCHSDKLKLEESTCIEIQDWQFRSAAPFDLARFQKNHCLLIGEVFSSRNLAADRKEIAHELSQCEDTDCFIESLKHLTGRFVAIYFLDNSLNVFGDAMGQFEVYHNSDCDIITSSLALFEQTTAVKNHSGAKKALYDKIEKTTKIQIGYTTKYVGVFHLMPNHFVDSIQKEQLRYYPSLEDLEEKATLEEGAKEIASQLLLYAKSIAKKKNLAIPVTGGNDSRILLGAFREHEFECFIFNHPDSNRALRDIGVAQKLLKSVNKELNIIHYRAELNDEGKNFYSVESRLPRVESRTYIWNAYQKYLTNDYILVGYGGEIGRSFFKNIKNVNAEMFAALMGYPGNVVVIEEMQRWIDKIGSDLLSHENIMDWFYWEQRMGNWGARLMTEVALVADQISPMNSRSILETMLKVPKKYRQFTANDLTKEVIKNLNPILLEVPINPSLKYRIIRMMVKVGIYDFYQNIRLRWIVKKHK